jgi:hypothetical protein|tara:strand:- start:91 stop:1026 length:936 start_codon:yes stop_codon:yes gene_type:complete
MIINVNPEFGYELVCAAPYAYWLHQRGELDKVITCKAMKPFYYFCDNVEERYQHRSLDNRSNGVQNLPNNWVHHNATAVYGKDYSELSANQQIEANGVLDYRQWTPPPYKEFYYDSDLNLPNKYVVISNRYNREHGHDPIGYFDIQSLYNMFDYFSNIGYDVIYKRPTNTEFVTDDNEWLHQNISADVEGHGIMTDFDLVSHFDNVHLIDDVIKKVGDDYNTSQLKIFARSTGFIAMGGGSSILCSYFNVPVIIYVNTSGDIRPGYFEGDSYFNKLSNAPIYPIIDKKDDIIKRGYRDYSQVYKTIKDKFG